MGDPDDGNCQATIAWHIQNGHYDQTKLDGLNIVWVLYAPGNMFTGPKMKMALYLDELASPEQYEALNKIFSGQAGGFFAAAANLIGETMGVRSVPIEFGIEGKRRWLRIQPSLELEIEAVTGAHANQESFVVNPGFTVAPGYDPVIAHSTKYTYHDHGLEWDNSGKNAFYSRFTYAP